MKPAPDNTPAPARIFKRLLPFIRPMPVVAIIFLTAGCAGSGGANGDTRLTTPSASTDTTTAVPEDIEELPAGKFTVQIGAYTSGESAKEVATRAEQRYARAVYTTFDGVNKIFRVMLGVFDTKDLARKFRDLIVRQYPEDYRDAWVSELAW